MIPELICCSSVTKPWIWPLPDEKPTQDRAVPLRISNRQRRDESGRTGSAAPGITGDMEERVVATQKLLLKQWQKKPAQHFMSPAGL